MAPKTPSKVKLLIMTSAVRRWLHLCTSAFRCRKGKKKMVKGWKLSFWWWVGNGVQSKDSSNCILHFAINMFSSSNFNFKALRIIIISSKYVLGCIWAQETVLVQGFGHDSQQSNVTSFQRPICLCCVVLCLWIISLSSLFYFNYKDWVTVNDTPLHQCSKLRCFL